jgi:uncharacterized membrane protein YphA (DoxX/SURF4 family)
MSGPLTAIDALFHRVRSIPFFLRFTLFTRILLAAAFIPTGMVKVLGRRFTVISPDDPIGAFFEAMYQTGLFWNFIGAVQVIAGVLLLIPRLAHIGAALFVPVVVNIFVITIALDFRGTPVVVGLMLLAVTYLCAWDYDRFRGLLTTSEFAPEHRPARLRLDPLERVGFLVFAAALLSFFLMTRGLALRGFGLIAIATGAAAGLFTLLRFLIAGRKLTPEQADLQLDS